MNTGRIEFHARLGRSTLAITIIVCAILGAVTISGLALTANPPAARWLMILAPVSILGGSALFMVRGYAIEGDALIVKRLGWETAVSLKGLRTADLDPHAMRGAVRYFGNGGLFCFCGRFWSRPLGRFRGYITDLRGGIVLGWPDKTIVISPARSDAFLNELRARGWI